jgi:4'-phosphopantetheinyl transferase
MPTELEIWTVPVPESTEAVPYLLSRATAAPRTALLIKRGPRGKPYLSTHPDVHFSITYSGDLALIAITRAGPVGIDIERVREVPEAAQISKRWLHGADPANFFDHWTRREAHLKALGVGLSGLDLPPPGPEWSLGNFTPAEGYVAAWAVESKDVEIVYRTWNA